MEHIDDKGALTCERSYVIKVVPKLDDEMSHSEIKSIKSMETTRQRCYKKLVELI